MLPTLKTAIRSLLPLFVLALTASLSGAASPARPPQYPQYPQYQLAVSFDLARGLLIGTARITIAAKETLTLRTGPLTITGLLLKRQDGSGKELEVPQGPTLAIPADPGKQELLVSFTFLPPDDGANLISPEGITLISDWYPLPARRMHYQLSATLPEGFTAVTEADQFPLSSQGNVVSAVSPHEVTAIHLIAARYAEASLEVRTGLRVHTLFFPEDAELAPAYLARARDFIRRYEEEIGSFPYAHYIIVANRNPTGFGMPGFTLLGQAVLRLPFIKDTSLGHEILHSWFGNSIEVDPAQGNWSEGLTAYLADHAFRQDQREGAAYRKEAILNYLSYVHDDTAIPLGDFGGGDPDQPQAQARRAVGYSRAMMLFHELHERLGGDLFSRAIRQFYAEFKNSTASWDDLRATFTSVTPAENLTVFFAERLSRTDIPTFHAENITVGQKGDESLLRFQLVQETETPYSLKVPIRVVTAQGNRYFTIAADSRVTEVALPLPGRPLEFTLDPEYALFRGLAPEERPAIWSQFLGSGKKLAILASRELEQTYRPLLQTLQDDHWTLKYDNEVANADLRESDLLLLGLDQQAVRNLFGAPTHPKDGITLEVRHNPLAPDRVAVLVSSSSSSDTAAVAHRLSHYGKYGYLHFREGRPTEQRVPESEAGISYLLEQLPQGGPTGGLNRFDTLAGELSDRDVIYIGESHTSVSDHRLQLRLLEAIAARVPDLAIGMEMFPASSQSALDGYVLGKQAMTEKEFLKKSRYFETWQYDYRYFREIFQLARQKRLPVIGLNLERQTVSTVYRTGSTDGLPAAARDSLPAERDLDMKGYSERLRAMQEMHEQGGHGNGLASGFIQAQAIWDETMAVNIVNHLRQHPGRKMVVLAGSQHTRKDSGIPPRVARRIAISQASVLNITGDANDAEVADLAEIADYFFLSEPMELAETPKMGLMLEEQKDGGGPFVKITDFSPDSKGPEAGLKKGDIVRRVAGYSITSMADIRIAMLDAAELETVKVQVERRKDGQHQTLDVAVQLQIPQKPEQHP